MASRMSRYTKTEAESKSRSAQNKDLYRRIYEDLEYTNIEGILKAPIDAGVDPDKIRELVTRREFENSRQIVRRNVEQKPLREIEYEDDRNYDIRDVLSQAKNERPEETATKYRNLNKHSNLNRFDDILLEKTDDFKKQEEELKELISTVTSGVAGNEEFNELDLFDDLRSNTMIGDSKSIRAIVNEEITKELQKTLGNTNTVSSSANISKGIDNTFLSNSLSFGEKDFKELQDMSKTIKKNNNLMITIISFIITTIIIIGVVWAISKVIK